MEKEIIELSQSTVYSRDTIEYIFKIIKDINKTRQFLDFCTARAISPIEAAEALIHKRHDPSLLLGDRIDVTFWQPHNTALLPKKYRTPRKIKKRLKKFPNQTT